MAESDEVQFTKATHISGWLGQLNSLVREGECTFPDFLKPFHLLHLASAAKRAEFPASKLPSTLESYAARMELWEAVDLVPPQKVAKREPAVSRPYKLCMMRGPWTRPSLS